MYVNLNSLNWCLTIAQGHGLTWRPGAGGHVRLLGSTGAASATVTSEVMTSEVMTSENMTSEVTI